MNRRNTLIFLLSVLCAGFSPSLGQAEEIPNLKMAQLNPEFIQYITGKRDMNGASGSNQSPAGRLPSPVNLSHVKGAGSYYKTAAFPAAFDLRNQNRVTPVRDQGNCGSCWAFGTFASLESCLLPGEETDFSELDLILTHGFDYNPCDGGSEFMCTAYLARWGGPLSESDMPYSYSSIPSGNEGLVRKHVHRVVFLPERDSYLDNGAIKHFLTGYGAVGISMYINFYSEYYNHGNSAYYCFKHETANHLVAVVGWDDNYPAGKFKISPPGNGAFIIKNSWGTKSGDDGYFYMSYYDNSLSYPISFNKTELQTNYGTNYQYDPLGWNSSWGYGNTTAWAANIFQAVNNQPVQAVGFYVNDINTNVRVFVYKGVSGNNPRSGSLKTSRSELFIYPGFYTVKLDSPVTLSKGDSFSVVTEFVNNSYKYPLVIEFPIDGYSSNASANPGESFVSHNGSDWQDMTTAKDNSNVCLKAYAGYAAAALDVQAGRETVHGWLVSKDIGRITINIKNIADISISKVIIYRRTSPLTPYAVCKEILPQELQNGSYIYTDFELEGENVHYYTVAVLNEAGFACGRSQEKTI